MGNNKFIAFRCLEVIQPIGNFYIGVMDAVDLIYISYADVIRIEKRDVEALVGIERPLNQSRVKDIKEYVKHIDATFPSSIIIAVSSEDAEYDSSNTLMKIRRDKNVAQIIDGQHRLAGLVGYSNGVFQLNVTVFIDMDIEDRAMVFATINLEQTKVSKSIVYSLYGYTKSRSPQKTCHSIAKLLNYKEGSPFKDKIKILGRATGKPQESLTQATFVERLLGLISDNPMEDRNLLKRGKKLKRAEGEDKNRLIFRNMFIDKKDAEIAKNIWNYFKAVENKWPDAWPEAIKGNVLNRTTGFGALMKFLRDVYVSFGKSDEVISTSNYASIFNKINLRAEHFTPERYKPGTSGETELYKELKEIFRNMQFSYTTLDYQKSGSQSDKSKQLRRPSGI